MDSFDENEEEARHKVAMDCTGSTEQDSRIILNA